MWKLYRYKTIKKNIVHLKKVLWLFLYKSHSGIDQSNMNTYTYFHINRASIRWDKNHIHILRTILRNHFVIFCVFICVIFSLSLFCSSSWCLCLFHAFTFVNWWRCMWITRSRTIQHKKRRHKFKYLWSAYIVF